MPRPPRDDEDSAVGDFPDVDLIESLASLWDSLAGRLELLATGLRAAVEGVEWAGDGREAAVVAAGRVAELVLRVAAAAREMASWLRKYAEQVRKAMRMALGSMIAGIVGLALAAVTGGLAVGFSSVVQAVIRVVSSVLMNLGISTRMASFLAEALLFGGIEVLVDVASRAIVAKIANDRVQDQFGPEDAIIYGTAVSLSGGLGINRIPFRGRDAVRDVVDAPKVVVDAPVVPVRAPDGDVLGGLGDRVPRLAPVGGAVGDGGVVGLVGACCFGFGRFGVRAVRGCLAEDHGTWSWSRLWTSGSSRMLTVRCSSVWLATWSTGVAGAGVRRGIDRRDRFGLAVDRLVEGLFVVSRFVAGRVRPVARALGRFPVPGVFRDWLSLAA
jgi:hypothetical protein